MLNRDKQQCEDYCEIIAAMMFLTHTKIVQMKISIGKQVWDLSKAKLQKAMKNELSPCKESLKCDHRYLNCF